MKSVILICTVLAINLQSNAFGDDKQAIKQAIQEFSRAGDLRDLTSLEALTDPSYRIVMNQLFGSSEISVMDRKTYLEMIRQEKFGGDDRKVEVKSIIISGKNAVAEVALKGKFMSINSIFTLSKNADGKWLFVSDIPTIVE